MNYYFYSIATEKIQEYSLEVFHCSVYLISAIKAVNLLFIVTYMS